MGMGRARVGVPPSERRLRATHVERVGAAAVGCSAHRRPERLAGHERGAAWRGCGSGGVERTVVPRDRGRPEGAPEALSARATPRLRRPPWAPTSIIAGPPRVGWGGQGRREVWGGKVVWWGSGVDTYLSRRSAPDFGPSRQHLRPPGYHRGRHQPREASFGEMLQRGLGRSPSIEAPQGIFFFGTVTFGKKILRKFHP